MTIFDKVQDLRNSSIKDIINRRMNEFKAFGSKSSQDIFNELCFCLLTANFSAEGSIKIQDAMGNGFITLSKEELAEQLAGLGHRFPNARAGFIFEARKYKDKLPELVRKFSDDKDARNWLAENVKGLGMKESSHFLRNIGHEDVAIIDFHILDLLARENFIEQPKNRSISRKKYLEIENILEKISEKVGISLGELDLYLWYLETGKILK